MSQTIISIVKNVVESDGRYDRVLAGVNKNLVMGKNDVAVMHPCQAPLKNHSRSLGAIRQSDLNETQHTMR